MTKTAETATTETLTYTRYSTYKASGVGWLGGIPAHWEVVRFSVKIQAWNKVG